MIIAPPLSIELNLCRCPGVVARGDGPGIGHYGGAIADSPAGEHVVEPQPNQVAAPELTVVGQVEHRKIVLGGESGHFRDLDGTPKPLHDVG
jgi:hypothetical protein